MCFAAVARLAVFSGQAEAGRPLDRFFDRWIYGTTLPRVKFGYRVETGDSGREVVLRAELMGELFDVPITATIHYTDQKSVDVVVPVIDRIVEVRVPLTGTLRGVEVSKDDTLAEIVK